MESPPLAKYLASNDKKVRDKAIKGLAEFISDPSREALPEAEMAKLWKGIFYCFWMSDKPLVQQALSSELAHLVLAITSTTAALAFLRGFWEAMIREWSGIDRFRLDKYLMLVRKYVNVGFRLLLRAKWEPTSCKQYNLILSGDGGPLCPTNNRVPVGITYHVCQIYVEELDKAIGIELSDDESEQDHVPAAPLPTLLAPLLTLAAYAPLARTYDRVQEEVFVPLLDALQASKQEEEVPRSRKRQRLNSGADTPFPHLIPHVSTVSPSSGVHGRAAKPAVLLRSLLDQIMVKASEEDTRDASRRRMYALYKQYADDVDSD